jgi:ankyrin repeat protein
MAVRARHSEVIEELVNQGANINAIDENGRTALHEGARALEA